MLVQQIIQLNVLHRSQSTNNDMDLRKDLFSGKLTYHDRIFQVNEHRSRDYRRRPIEVDSLLGLELSIGNTPRDKLTKRENRTWKENSQKYRRNIRSWSYEAIIRDIKIRRINRRDYEEIASGCHDQGNQAAYVCRFLALRAPVGRRHLVRRN